MGARPDYYEVLQVSPNADAEVIDAAYRRLALRWHPDRNPGDPVAAERMTLLNEAYAVLSDVSARREHDLRRNEPFAGVGGEDDSAPTPASKTNPGTTPRPRSEPSGGEVPPPSPFDRSSGIDPEQRASVSPFARVLCVLGVFLFVMAHGVDLFTQTLVFLLGCLCWGFTFGLPAYLCVRYGKQTGVSVVAALFFLAAALDVWSRLANRSDDPVRVEAPRTHHEKQLTPPNSFELSGEGNHRPTKGTGLSAGASEPREGMAFPGGIDFSRPPTPKGPARVEPGMPPKKPEADERQERNKKRLQEIANAIRALDSAIPIHSQKDWRSCTTPYRVGKLPSETARDSLIELLVQLEMSEQGRMRVVERSAAQLRMTAREYCLENGYPLPQDHKSGDWKKLRDALAELEY